jgi:hypothetical protein
MVRVVTPLLSVVPDFVVSLSAIATTVAPATGLPAAEDTETRGVLGSTRGTVDVENNDRRIASEGTVRPLLINFL